MKKHLCVLRCLLIICVSQCFQAKAEDWQRTTIFIFGQTQSGQDMFIRGGLDHNQAKVLMGLNCTAENKLCAMPIRHLNLSNTTTTPWKQADKFLDWQGIEAGQPAAAQGSPADWTTNVWPAAWGAKKTVLVNGVGETPLNTWGDHYWMLDVEMDCSRTFNGWFELKSFISNGPGWESNVSQAGRPYVSANHFAKCGKINKFERGSSAALIKDFPAGEALAPVQFRSDLNNFCLSTSVDTTQAGSNIVQASCNSNRSLWKLAPIKGGLYQVKSKVNGMCLGVVGDQLGNANLGQQVCSQTIDARLWRLNRTNQVPLNPDTLISDTQNGTYELRNGAGFLCADNNKSTTVGTLLTQSLCKHENNQRWKVASNIPDTAEKIEFNLLVITKPVSDLSGTVDWMSSKTATEQALQRQRKWSEVALPGFFHDYSNGRIKLNVYYYESPYPLTQLSGHGAVSPVEIPEDLDIIVNPGWFDGIYVNHSTTLQNGLNGLVTYGWSDGHFTTGVSNSPIDDTTPAFMGTDIAQVGGMVHEFTHQLEYYFFKNPSRQKPTAACAISSPGASLLDCGSNEPDMGGYGVGGPTDGLGNHLALYRDYLNGYIKNGTLGLGDPMWSLGNVLREINAPAVPGGPLAAFANKTTCLNLTTPSGVIAKSLQGDNNFARVNNVNKSLNWTGSGFLFDGVDDYLRIGNLIGDDFTTSFWIKSGQVFPTVNSSAGIGLVYAGADNGGGFELRGLRSVSGNDVISFQAGNNLAIIGSTDVTTNLWVHIAVVRNQKTGLARLYVNGKEDASGNAGVQRLNKNPIVKIGSAFQFKKIGESTLSNDHFSGEMADFCLQNTAADAMAISQSAQSRKSFAFPQGQQTQFLSDLTMFSATTGYGGIGRDTGISGGPLVIQGKGYSKGLGVHAPSKIVYKLDGSALRFISDIGVDDDVPDGQGVASTDFQVYGDGNLLYQSKIKGDNDLPETIDVDIRGVKELTLVVGAGEFNIATGDHADWGNARILK